MSTAIQTRESIKPGARTIAYQQPVHVRMDLNSTLLHRQRSQRRRWNIRRKDQQGRRAEQEAAARCACSALDGDKRRHATCRVLPS
ncbi:hypothetical protein PR202_gb20965 [Eleusine coracana subsp. coracana]|uniref:Uncharacterized protein n=1 Tax=Eleusine coracana subsp. coracana TaxID=191504 RepID=A0AAV5FCS0_ELECO|nr:hypothetical protein PR202_gb20965 [Eleusine coracana subsp. coracana]